MNTPNGNFHTYDAILPIERNVPMPDFKSSSAKYPWRQLLVGDSFIVGGKKAAVFAAYCRDKGKKLGREFRCRDIEGGVRVWRTA